jgi:hypothetical protein
MFTSTDFTICFILTHPNQPNLFNGNPNYETKDPSELKISETNNVLSEVLCSNDEQFHVFTDRYTWRISQVC